MGASQILLCVYERLGAQVQTLLALGHTHVHRHHAHTHHLGILVENNWLISGVSGSVSTQLLGLISMFAQSNISTGASQILPVLRGGRARLPPVKYQYGSVKYMYERESKLPVLRGVRARLPPSQILVCPSQIFVWARGKITCTARWPSPPAAPMIVIHSPGRVSDYNAASQYIIIIIIIIEKGKSLPWQDQPLTNTSTLNIVNHSFPPSPSFPPPPSLTSLSAL